MTQFPETNPAAHEYAIYEPDPQQIVGSVALGEAKTEDMAVYAPLPEGYHYDMAMGLTDKEEVANLLSESGLVNAATSSDLETTATWNEKFGIHSLEVGVRTSNGLLVGYGTLQYKDGIGEMGDLVVLPGHRNHGIGTALIDTRVKSADALGLKTLFIEGLQNTNGLRKHYEGLGFHELSGGNLGRGENPKMIEL